MIILLNISAIAFENYFIFKMLCKFKNIKDKKIKLYFGLLIIYFISALLTNFDYLLKIYFYVIYAFLTYYLLKFIYKKSIILDVFILNIISVIIMLSSFIFLSIIKNYWIAFIFYIMALTIIMNLKINYNGFYKKYIKLWNRRDDGKIKALTIRNLSLYFINIILFLANILLPYIKIKSGM